METTSGLGFLLGVSQVDLASRAEIVGFRKFP